VLQSNEEQNPSDENYWPILGHYCFNHKRSDSFCAFRDFRVTNKNTPHGFLLFPFFPSNGTEQRKSVESVESV
jgi:hypothetical protein